MADPIFPVTRISEIKIDAHHAFLSGKSEKACPYPFGFEREEWMKEFHRASFEMQCQ